MSTAPPPPSESAPSLPPLVVELEGVLARTDTLHEGLLRLLKHQPHLALAAVGWGMRGGGLLRAEVARHEALDVTRLPYDEALLTRLAEERARGRRLVLATRADRRVAEAVAGHLGLFEVVLASDDTGVLSGARREARLKEALGGGWEEARPGPARSLPRAMFKALRVHQWAKNVLVFVPVLAAHKGLDAALLLRALLGFVAFSLCASSVYVLNDMLDLDSDRKHPTKRRRPFASGDLPVRVGPWLALGLLGAGAAVATATLPAEFLALLGTYYAVTLGYSFYFKQVMMLDVLLLAGLYTVRILGGSLAVGVPTSSWLFTFSMFLFLSLALVKRLSEVRRLRQTQETVAPGRGYVAGDYEQLGALGVTSGYLSVLVLALYITSREVTVLYAHPERLWLLCPVMMYWVGRVWLLAHRGEVNEDPLIFALKDGVSYAVGLLAAGVLLVAT